MNFGLSQSTIEKITSVLNKYPEIEEAIIYGSRAKGNYREGSDIDLSLKGKSLTDNIRSKIWLDLDDLNTPYLIDLSVYHSLQSDHLNDHINRIGQVFYKNTRDKVPS